MVDVACLTNLAVDDACGPVLPDASSPIASGREVRAIGTFRTFGIARHPIPLLRLLTLLDSHVSNGPNKGVSAVST
jgi:hypothetical protein